MMITALLAGAAPGPPPVEVAQLLTAVDELERIATTDEEKARWTKPRKALGAVTAEKPMPPGEMARLAEEILARGPDVELVHTQVLRVLLTVAPRAEDAVALQKRIHAHAASFVEKNPTSVAGHQLYADVLFSEGDEEGQLRALAACGEGCNAGYVQAARRWTRLRCSAEGIAGGLVLRMGSEVIARARDVAFLEPAAADGDLGSQCTLQLEADAAGRLRARTATVSATRPETLIVLHGVLLVVDVPLVQTQMTGTLSLPAVVCERLCRAPRPRPLPGGLHLSKNRPSNQPVPNE